MKTRTEEITTKTNWTGSEKTAKKVQGEIEQRWGKKAAALYDPEKNCRTYMGWQMIGYQVKKGEKSIRSYTMIKKENKETGEKIEFIKPCHLFYIKQVEKKPKDERIRISK